MTKQIFFIFAVFYALQAQASVRSMQEDTVQHTVHYEVRELLQPIQPVYLDGVVLPVFRTGNWFVSVAGGTTAFWGAPLGCEDLFGRLRPSYSLAVGKWFTPSVGARINYGGLQFKDAMLSSQNYHHIHMRICYGMSLVEDTPRRNRYVGDLRPLLVSDCCTMPPMGTIPLPSLTAYRDNTISPNV